MEFGFFLICSMLYASNTPKGHFQVTRPLKNMKLLFPGINSQINICNTKKGMQGILVHYIRLTQVLHATITASDVLMSL